VRHGFKIPAAWLIRETNQFVWLLSYDGPEEWQDKEVTYYDSPERLTMHPDPAQLIARNETYDLEDVYGLPFGLTEAIDLVA
jgi:hypothetical protein